MTGVLAQPAQDGPPPPDVVSVRPHGSRPVEYKNLLRTILVEVLTMAIVVGVSRARRRRRRAAADPRVPVGRRPTGTRPSQPQTVPLMDQPPIPEDQNRSGPVGPWPQK